MNAVRGARPELREWLWQVLRGASSGRHLERARLGQRWSWCEGKTRPWRSPYRASRSRDLAGVSMW